MTSEIISEQFIILIVTSVIMGTLARILTLIVDYRQYPSYPNGYLIHIVTGFIAAALGAVAIPAVVTNDFQAVTFLALALEQFRDVRRMENESLQALDDMETVIRGQTYIDGIAKTFEARNYFSLVVSFATGLTMELIPNNILLINILSGILVGTIVFLILKRFSKGKSVGDIADVKLGKVSVKGSELYVDDIFVTNHIGTDYAKELIQNNGLAAVVSPYKERYRITLDNMGQRQAILFEVYRVLGVKRYHFTRRDHKSGRIVIFIVPIINDSETLIDVIKKTPLLESVKKSYEIMSTNLINNK